MAPKEAGTATGNGEPIGPASEGAAADATAGAGEQAAPREASLAGWLRRLGSGALGGRSGSASGVAQEGEGSQAGSEAGSQRASPSPVTAASRVASANHRRGLSAALEDLPALASSGDEAGPMQPAEQAAAVRGASPTPRPPRPPSAGALASPAAATGLRRTPSLGRASPSPGRASPLLSRVDVLREGSTSMGGMPLMLFPDTEEGHLAQASWFSPPAVRTCIVCLPLCPSPIGPANTVPVV